MSKLYRAECSKCGNVEFADTVDMGSCPDCDDKYAAMVLKPSLEHDKEIMEEPDFACPDCGQTWTAFALENGKDWKCDSRHGGCGFYGWREENNDIPAPKDQTKEEGARASAWSRYQRSQRGHYEYR